MRVARRLVPLLAAALLLPRASAAQSFEGTLHQRMTMLGPDEIAALLAIDPTDRRPDPEALFAATDERLLANAAGTYESSMAFKGARVRMQMADGQVPSEMAEMMKGAFTIFDFDAKQMTMVVPVIGRAMVTTAAEMAQLGMDDSVATLAHKPDVTARELGAATLSGRSTKTFEMVDGESVSRVWVASELESVAATLKTFGSTMMSLFGARVTDDTLDRASALFGKGLPVRTQTLTRAPSDVGTPSPGWMFLWTETSVESGPLADSLFVVPAGIEVMKMPGAR